MPKRRQTEMGATNFLEIRACGLQRSGNHAILSWVQAQHSGKPCCFLNNVRHGNYDPYTNYSQRYLTGLDERLDTEMLRATPKHLLIYSYEDDERMMDPTKDFLSSVFDPDFEANREQYLRTSKNAFDILIVRDPFNFLASRLKKLEGLTGVKDPRWIANNWKYLATEALRLDANPAPGKMVVNYNRWFKDSHYREQLSRTLMGTFDDSSMEQMSSVGGGSSFDSMEYDRLTFRTIAAKWTELFNPRRYLHLGRYLKRLTAPKAHEMRVMERWKFFVEDDAYRAIFADPEMLELSENLFGEIPGMREYVARIMA